MAQHLILEVPTQAAQVEMKIVIDLGGRSSSAAIGCGPDAGDDDHGGEEYVANSEFSSENMTPSMLLRQKW
jgi:hypothetical protein